MQAKKWTTAAFLPTQMPLMETDEEKFYYWEKPYQIWDGKLALCKNKYEFLDSEK